MHAIESGSSQPKKLLTPINSMGRVMGGIENWRKSMIDSCLCGKSQPSSFKFRRYGDEHGNLRNVRGPHQCWALFANFISMAASQKIERHRSIL